MARYFTKQQIAEIAERLATRSVRDSDFEVSSTLKNSDFVAIVQGGVNKKLSFQALFDTILALLEDSGIIDLSSFITREEVAELISDLKEFVYVDVLPTASSETAGKIYLIPSANPKTQNEKDEYITVKKNDEYTWEQIGTTAIDLSGYSTTEEMETAISSAITEYDDSLSDIILAGEVLEDNVN